MDWNDDVEIGAALARAYPEANHLTISDTELIRLVTRLPGFTGAAQPPDVLVLTDIGLSWIAALTGPDDSSPYEGSAADQGA